MKDNKQQQTDYDALLLVLNVGYIARIMGVSKVSVYRLVHSEGFPATQIKGRLIRVSKLATDKFYNDW
jgi:excisionase family DNA binding protein